ncbi:dentin sialophosphoprotein-like [Bacillus rossius redtenbacheri]|uniref:dentin sialophosphoprotein-like n=1 Tax=Bacillus rossius redtenbacheri TaxID=93214 RepID=UPI002FDC9B63
MESSSDNGETLSDSVNGTQSNNVETFIMKTENENIKVIENVTSGETVFESTNDKSQASFGDCENGQNFVESTCYDVVPTSESLDSGTHDFFNSDTTETQGCMDSTTSNENTTDDALSLAENAIEACTFESNGVEETNGFKENATHEKKKSEETKGKRHEFEEPAVVETHNVVENSDSEGDVSVEKAVEATDTSGENVGDKIDSTVDGVGDDTQTFIRNARGEANQFINNDVGAELQVSKDLGPTTCQQDVSNEDLVSSQNTTEASKAYSENDSFETCTTTDHSKASVEADDKPNHFPDVDDGKRKAPQVKREFDIKLRGPVTGRRSYRGDVADPLSPSSIVAERLRRSKEPSLPRVEPGSTAKQDSGVVGRKRRLITTGENQEVENKKKKKTFPQSLFSYFSYLSSFPVFSLLRPAQPDVVVQETLLTDESGNESD